MTAWRFVVGLSFVLGGCADSGLAPNGVASPWVKEAFDKEPDVVVSVDVAAMRRDPLFGKLSALIMADAPLPYDAVLGARRLDLFGTVQGAFTAVVYGAGPLAPELERCLSRDSGLDRLTVSAQGGQWVVSNAHETGTVPHAVRMDGGTLLEAWLGPAAVDKALDRTRWDAREMWSHLHALRMRVEGGGTPGLVVDARFETAVDAEHAQYDLARMEREVRRGIADVRDDELGRQLLEQLPNVHVRRSGADLAVDFRLTASFTRYVSNLVDHDASPRRTRDGCGDGGGRLGPPPPLGPPTSSAIARSAMPAGETWSGLYYHPVFGYLHLVEREDKVTGRWERTDKSARGQLSGTKAGNVVHFEWTETKDGVVGPSATVKGKGYFVYEVGDTGARLHGEYGLGDAEVGGSWDSVKQSVH